jgi:hypothetical protein
MKFYYSVQRNSFLGLAIHDDYWITFYDETDDTRSLTVTAVSGAGLSTAEEVSIEKNDENASVSPNPFTNPELRCQSVTLS